SIGACQRFLFIFDGGVRVSLPPLPTRRSSDLAGLVGELATFAIGRGNRGTARQHHAQRLGERIGRGRRAHGVAMTGARGRRRDQDRKSTRLNSSHVKISYDVFSLQKKNSCVEN